MKFSLKRTLSFLLAFVMVVSLFPAMRIIVSAAALGETGVDWTYSKAAGTAQFTASVSDDVITASTNGKTTTFPFTITTNSNGTVSLKNTLSTSATLSVKCKITAYPGKVTISGYTTLDSTKLENTYLIELDAGASAIFTIYGKDGYSTNVTFSDIKLIASGGDTVKTTFAAPAYGSYTINDGTDTTTVSAGSASQIFDKAPSTQYTLTAVPGTGYKFVGWYDETNSKYLSTTNPAQFAFATATTVKPIIVPSNSPIFAVGNTKSFTYKYIPLIGSDYTYYTVNTVDYYTDLNEAVAAANSSSTNKYVVLVSDGTLPAGNYNIPSGVTLLLPYESTYISYRSEPKVEEIPSAVYSSTAKVYSKLTLSPNTTITVDGAIELAASHYAAHGGKTLGGTPVSGYGQIEMSSGSSIVLNSGANLYAWGYITGSGSVTAKSGSKIYEKMQVSDYRGGQRTDAVVGEGVFPFNQYYIQNVEVSETIEAGATMVCHAGIYAYSIQIATVDFMGGESAMFALTSGSVTKRYDASSDRLILDVNGAVSMNPITILGENTADFNLPLNHNITVNVKSGSTATVNQHLMLQPGAIVNIEQGATMTINEGKNVYLMHSDQWDKYCFAATMRPVTYVASRNGAPVSRALTNASMNINGTLIVNGALYTSASGCDIVSEGKTGKVVFNSAAPADTTIKQCISGGEETMKYVDISVKSAVLTHGGGSYLETAGADAGTEYNYCAECDAWYKVGFHTVTWVNGSEILYSEEDVANCTAPSYKGTTPTKAATTQYTYTFAGWSATDGGAVLETLPHATGDVTYYAVFNAVERIYYTVTWNINGVTSEDDFEDGTVPSYKGTTPTKAETAQYTYTFAGWATTENGTVLSELPAVTDDVTYYAVFTEVTKSYTVTWNINGDTTGQEFAYGATPSYSKTTPTKASDADYHYTFAGWAATENGTVLSALPAVTGDVTYYAVFTATAHDDDKIEGGKHYCTACDHLIGSCNDATKDHKCDVGGEQMVCCAEYLTSVSKKDATCEDAGYEAHYECSCGKLYSDAYAQNEISEPVAIPATDHAWGVSDYTDNGDGTHTANYVCGNDASHTKSDEPETHTYTDGVCDCDAIEPVKNVTVKPVTGNVTVTYTVSGQVVTVTHSIACKVGYWSEADGKYIALPAVANPDGGYDFTAPDGVTEVILVVKGDANTDGKITMADATRTRAAYNSKITLTVEQRFAADVNNSDSITMADATSIRAVYNSKKLLTWN